jgi:L-lactate dehydrogenase complex protein LldF
MTEQAQKFKNTVQQVVSNEDIKTAINEHTNTYEQAVGRAKGQYERLDLAKQRAAKIRRYALDDLEKYLKDFESNFQKNGGEIIWAVNAQEAIKAVSDIVDKHSIKRVVKSKSMVSQEIDLLTHLHKMGVDTVDTEMEDYLMHLAGLKPSHFTSSAYEHKAAEFAKILSEKYDFKADASEEEIAAFVKGKLRPKFFQADMGISTADFLIANQGAISISENEGNAVFGASFPRVHLAISSIDKVIPDVNDLDLLWSLKSTFSHGQDVQTYNHIISGPRKPKEQDGPDKMYLILIDNGRSKVLNTEFQREALSCISCGACSNICPVVQTIGDSSYQTSYTGPIGSVLAPLMLGQEAYDHLNYACTLCGLCTDECPVEIPIHELLLYNRKDAVSSDVSNADMAAFMHTYKRMTKSRWMLDLPGAGIKKLMLNMKIKRNWGPQRQVPKPAKKSFNKQWKEAHK